MTQLLQRGAEGPSPAVPADALWHRGRRRRRRVRLSRSLAALAAVAAVSALIGQLPLANQGGSDVQFVPAQPGARPEPPPPGWRTVQIAEAAFSVPQAWSVKPQPGEDGELLCLDAGLGGHAVYLAESLYSPPCPPPPPESDEPAAELAVYALPMDSAGGPHPGGRAFSTGTVEGTVRIFRDLHEYEVPDLNLLLIMGPAEPALAKKIVDSIRPADPSAQEPDTFD